MRLLLDECVPRPLKRELVGHALHHVVDMGWSSKRNGELLRLMVSGRFEALLTVDRNLEFQQNLRAAGVGVVLVIARTNRLKELSTAGPRNARCHRDRHAWRTHKGWWLTGDTADGDQQRGRRRHRAAAAQSLVR